ncbi:uncharacterized protein N7469_008204 [Penicillium citrinum]|uniref:DUF7907 domain-containing protein n=2 Tax=Penicillium TaxID=5073 RepID=A0A9W9NRA1_PENCI|nr:uncharacterized protein N7469_008204 [Penicillium citrinum]KAJ5224701.1 hypothetical protein N7469_008204 [Penicillium citrinum]KAJ5574955.1 hypothetical protein N7450_008854 [Penicillium hetheringtonii]
MKFIAALSSLVLLGAATAQEIQSKPFNLVIQSEKKAINGQKLAACHSGAAIESLCLAGGSGSEFYLNTTKGEQAPIKGQGLSGTLVWNLPIGGDEPFVESEPMSFYVDPSTNVAQLLFQPSYDQQQVMFDTEGNMGIYSYLDDTVTPPKDDKVKILRNWYVCETNYSAYQYRTLNWVLGNGKAKPQNPSCVKVQVHRKFV